VAAVGSPTVRRRRLAAELRRLRGNNRTGGEIARALGWSPAKISRYELGQGGFPPDEVGKLLDFYGVTEPRRTQLLNLAADANARGWWEDYADALTPEYVEFIGLEAEASFVAQWQVETIPGLLQTKEYAACIHNAIQSFWPTSPSVIEQRVEVRTTRQLVLTERDPPLELSVVLDESAMLRDIGGSEVMRAQLTHLAEMAEMPNVELRVRPLRARSPLMTSSFVLFGFDSVAGTQALGDVVSMESVGPGGTLFVEGDVDTYQYRLLFSALADSALSPDDSLRMIRKTAKEAWVVRNETLQVR
jgi:transcriptional regulator with XRE-family HTH domain